MRERSHSTVPDAGLAKVKPLCPPWLGRSLGVAGALLATGWLAWHQGLPREAAFMGGIFVLAAVYWVTEALPLFATALLVIGLEVMLLGNPGAWAGFGFAQGQGPSWQAILNAVSDPILLLFLGGFLLARAAVKTGVDRTLSAVLLRPFGHHPRHVLLGLIIVTSFFSMWMSNTAATAMMLALCGPLLAQLSPGDAFRKAIVLAIPFAANLGGMATPIGSPPNAVAIGFLQKAGLPIGFLEWMLVGVPLLILLAGALWWLLWKFYPPHTALSPLRLESAPLTPTGRKVLVVTVITVLCWLTDRWHGIPASLVALLPILAFTIWGILGAADFNTLDWDVLILIGGGLALGAGMQWTGLDKVIVGWLPAGGSFGLLLGLLVVATLLLGTFMSNTAAANLFLPIGVSAASLAGGAETETARMALSIALTASLSMALPISTPPNTLAYARGEFQTLDMIRVGGLLGLIGVGLVLGLGGFLMRLAGL